MVAYTQIQRIQEMASPGREALMYLFTEPTMILHLKNSPFGVVIPLYLYSNSQEVRRAIEHRMMAHHARPFTDQQKA
ncbi:hypothetical protein [Calidithermus terrae]|uniref:hypothetical protein n=1 Tax=Calidithermus terrae TaxID=1408545 RepID=UPI0011C3F83F|nr:hypothetical protein [Calidithermus terrae]